MIKGMFKVYMTEVALVACALASTVNAQQVKNIQADKFRYLKENFAPDSVSKSVRETIAKTDNGSVNFQRLMLTGVMHVTTTKGGNPPILRGTWTYLSAAGPFIETVGEFSSNGFPVSQFYTLNYRGLLLLETQQVFLAENEARPALIMKNLKAFAALDTSGGGTGEFEWKYQQAPHRQILGLKDTALKCTYGAVHPASDIQRKLQGNAQDLNCEFRNDSNIATSQTAQAILINYGIIVVTSTNTAGSTIDIAYDDAHIE